MRGLLLVVLSACTQGPAVACDTSTLYGAHGWTLDSPAGTTFQPTVIFDDPSGEHPDECYYTRNQGDAVCTEEGGWVDNNPGAQEGTIDVTPFDHACGTFTVDSTYTLQYSFKKVPGILWIEAWSNDD